MSCPNSVPWKLPIHEVPPELQCENAEVQNLAVVARDYYLLLPKSTKVRVFWREETPDSFNLVRSQKFINLKLSLLQWVPGRSRG